MKPIHVILFLVCALIGFQSDAVAQETRYRVINVPVNDTLALRAGPDHRTTRLASISRNSLQVMGSGPIRIKGGARWVKVTAVGQSGWVNGRFLAPYASKAAATKPDMKTKRAQTSRTEALKDVSVRAPKPLSANLDCLGDRPFWTLRTSPTSLRLRDANANTKMWQVDGPANKAWKGGWAIRGRPSTSQPSLVDDFSAQVSMTRTCPAMETYGRGLKIEFQLGRESFRGCCALVTTKRST